MASFTPNYDLEKPVVGGDLDVWGGKLNTNFDKVDTAIKARADATATVATNLATLDAAVVKKDGTVAMSGPLVLPAGNPTLGTHATNKSYVDNGLAVKSPLASPTFTGTPAAPTASAGTNTTQIATTEFVTSAVATGVSTYAPLASPNFTGTPTISSAAIATQSYVNNAVAPIQYWVRKVKSSTNTITSNTTYATDADLQFNVTAGTKYSYRGVFFIYYKGSVKIRFSGPTVTVLHNTHQSFTGLTGATGAQAAGNYTAYPATNMYAVPGGSTDLLVTVMVDGIIQPSANGTFEFQFAQNTASANATQIKVGSYLEYFATA